MFILLHPPHWNRIIIKAVIPKHRRLFQEENDFRAADFGGQPEIEEMVIVVSNSDFEDSDEESSDGTDNDESADDLEMTWYWSYRSESTPTVISVILHDLNSFLGDAVDILTYTF